MRARVEVLEEARARVQAQARAGRYEEGLLRASEVVEAARDVGHPPLLAGALLDRAALARRQGRLHDGAEDLREAWSLALSAGDDALAAEIGVDLVFVLGHAMRVDEADMRTEEARAMIGRVRRHDPRNAEALDANLDEARGTIELRHHRYAEAVELYERALAVVERQAGPEGLRTAQALNAIASARLPARQWDEALALFERVLRIRSKQLGPAHPETAQTRNNIGLTLKNMGRLEEAAAQLEQARTLVIASLGPAHPSRRMAEMNLADVYYMQERYREAADLYTLAFGPEGVEAIDNEWELRRATHYGMSLAATGRLSQARRVLGLVHARAGVLASPYTVRVIELELARIELGLGRPTLALTLIEQMTPPEADLPDAVTLDLVLTRARALAARGELQRARALQPAIQAGAGKLMHPEDLEQLLVWFDEDPP